MLPLNPITLQIFSHNPVSKTTMSYYLRPKRKNGRLKEVKRDRGRQGRRQMQAMGGRWSRRGTRKGEWEAKRKGPIRGKELTHHFLGVGHGCQCLTYIITHLIFTKSLFVRVPLFPHFTEEENEAQQGEVTCPSLQS